MAKRVSIVDVARHAGVSVSTVSLVMNNRPNVAPDTAAAVWESVKSLGYAPGGDGKKRGPKPGPRKNTQFSAVGLLMTGIPAARLWGSTYLKALQGIQGALREKHLNLALYHVENPEQAREVLRRNPLDAVIVFGEISDQKLVQYLRRQSCVQVFGTLPSEGLWDHVTFDDAALGRLAAQCITDLGHKRAVFIGTDCQASIERSEMFRVVLGRKNVDVAVFTEPDLISYSGREASVDRDSLRRIVREICPEGTSNRLGIFVCNDLIASVFYSVAYELGLFPCDDVDVVCCNGRYPYMLGAYPPPAIIDVHAEQIGSQAVDQALWRREHRNEPHVVRLVSPRLVVP